MEGGEMGRAGAQSLGVISQGCLAGSKAGAAGSLRLRSGEVPARLAVPWASAFPAPRPPLRVGGLHSPPQRKDVPAASADPFRSPTPNSSFTLFLAFPTETLWSKLGREGREPPHFWTPRESSFKASFPPYPPLPTPKPVSWRAEPGLPQHKAEGRCGHGAE